MYVQLSNPSVISNLLRRVVECLWLQYGLPEELRHA